ncbi:MAG: radical SAM protein [Smithella sp.]
MQYKNVLCIYPYRKELGTVGFLPPIGLEYIAGAIEDRVDRIDIIDLRYEKNPWSDFINPKTDLVLVSHNWDIEKEQVEHVINGIPAGPTVIVGGRYATTHSDELFLSIPRIDAIVRGDGEEIIRQIVEKGLSVDIAGLSFRENEKIIHNANRVLEPVGGRLYPNRKLRRYKYMVTIDEFNTGLQIDMMLASRGCPFNCKFCDFKFNPLGEKRKWSCRTPESVVSELKTIEARVVGFADDIFTADMEWVGRLCDLILQEDLKKKFVVNARLEIAKRPDILDKMYKAGFMGFLLGVESAHDKTLQSMNKNFTIADIKNYFKVLKKYNFIYHCYFIIGNIGETREEMYDIIHFAHALGVDTLGLSVLRATKYSPLKGMIAHLPDYHIEQDSGKVYSDRLSVEDLQQIRRNVNTSFFSVPLILRILKKMIIHRMLTFGRVYKILIYTLRRKIHKIARKKSIRMGEVVR